MHKAEICRWMVTVLLFCASGSQIHAAIACPVVLLDGTVDRDGVTFAFRNKGKLPLQQLSFDCLPGGAAPAHRSLCHVESGLFYPGTDYTVSFAYPHAKGWVLVSLSVARQSDGSLWMQRRDDLCHPLRVRPKRAGRK